jgi:hypothetical protein
MDMLPEKGTFADLFAGCGTFTGPMLARGPVDAYDNVTSAIRALDKAKGPKPLKAILRDLYRNPIEGTETKRYDAVVFDPPRAGAEQQARTLARSEVPLVIGASCNPATFARDARILVDGGYDLNSVTMLNWSPLSTATSVPPPCGTALPGNGTLAATRRYARQAALELRPFERRSHAPHRPAGHRGVDAARQPAAVFVQ